MTVETKFSMTTYPWQSPLDAPPSVPLSNRNHPNTRYMFRHVLFFEFEIAGDDEFWETIWPNLGGLHQHKVYGPNRKAVEIAVLDNNAERLGPHSHEGIDKAAKALGHPPKVYVSIEYPWWRTRSQYHYSCKLFLASLFRVIPSSCCLLRILYKYRRS